MKRRRRKKKPTFNNVYQFKITLQEVEPPVWRRIQVPESYDFWSFHVAIQDAMGWLDYHLHELDYHLHEFELKHPVTSSIVRLGIPDEDFAELDDHEVLPGWGYFIEDWFSERNKIAKYLYDFGDGWEHAVELETIVPRQGRLHYPRCLDGARACPPEDCGGDGGYANLLEVLRDPNHEEYASTKTWVGRGFAPERFRPDKIHFWDPEERFKIAFSGR